MPGTTFVGVIGRAVGSPGRSVGSALDSIVDWTCSTRPASVDDRTELGTVMMPVSAGYELPIAVGEPISCAVNGGSVLSCPSTVWLLQFGVLPRASWIGSAMSACQDLYAS